MSTPKPTIGQAITELVEKYGNHTGGLYILEAALCEAVTGSRIELVKINDKLIHDHDRPRQIRREEAELLRRWNEQRAADR